MHASYITHHIIAMKLIYIFFNLMLINIYAAESEPIEIENSTRGVTEEERLPFYQQLNRTSRNRNGEIAKDALEPVFTIISTGSVDDIKSIRDDIFNQFVAEYMVARHLFKESFNVVLMFSQGSSVGEEPKHNMAANLPVNKMDDMVVWAWSVRCQIEDPKQRMFKQMSFVKFKTVTESGKKNLVPTNQILLASKPIDCVLEKYGMPKEVIPDAVYYKELTRTGVRYRIFTKIMCDDGNPYSCLELPSHSDFSSVFLGDVQIPQDDWVLKDTRDKDYLTNPRHEYFYQCGVPTVKNGAIFRKNGTLFERSGIVVIPRKPFNHCYLVLSYYKDYKFDQMCIEERAIITRQSVDRLAIGDFIASMGGFDKIDTEGLGFLEYLDGHEATHECSGFESSHYQHGISPAQARHLLPYLYLLSDDTGEPSDPSQTEGVITLLENILADEDEKDLMDDEEKDDAEDDNQGMKELAATIKRESVSAIPARTTFKSVSKEVDTHSKQRQEEESLTKRIRKLEGIREHFKNIAAKLKHHSLDETQNILARLHAALSHHGIHATGKSRTRGDHFGFEITDESTGNSTLVGLVLRGREGFQSGTVKKIIRDHVDKALKLLGVINKIDVDV